MYRRLIIVSAIIITAFAAFSILGFHSINLHAEGLEGKRIVEFSEVAEQIRIDVKQKLNELILKEQKRPYTDYQYFYAPEAVNNRFNNDGNVILRSPLAESMSHGMAYGHFQIEPNGKIISPFYAEGLNEKLDSERKLYLSNLNENIANTLKGNPNVTAYLNIKRKTLVPKTPLKSFSCSTDQRTAGAAKPATCEKLEPETQKKLAKNTRANYKLDFIRKGPNQKSQLLTQSRNTVIVNQISNTIPSEKESITLPEQKSAADKDITKTRIQMRAAKSDIKTNSDCPQVYADENSGGYNYEQTLKKAFQNAVAMTPMQQEKDEMVQIRIEPFYPITVKAGTEKDSYFGSQVFLLRHVQIENSHFLQGFRLNEKELIAEVKQSASQLLRSGMAFKLSKNESPEAAYAAVLDFEFGQVVLNLMELKPQWIAKQVSQLKNWYFAIVSIVLIATLMALVSLWRNLNAQVKLARKKDDFISAVSHELRTPLTTIRMYTEMLEKNWIKTDDKRTEYYSTMRQESERLTRLIENVLDFSRIQRGKKRYNFALGDINSCIKEVVEMMTPCAAKQNFTIETELDNNIQSTSFDSDAIMQIVINLIDNALKYAANATEKTITVRTRTEGKYVLIEVADHGPGIPHTQRKKIFDEFYRIGEESKRETTGTGLGLALVKRFADAHNGFVEAISEKPNGTLLRVAIAATNT